MSLITEKPQGIPSGNDLDKIDDDLLGGPPPPAEIRMSGKTLLTLENPPQPGDEIVLMIRLKINGHGVDLHDNDEEVPFRKSKLVSCWKPGSKEPARKKSKEELEAEEAAKAAKNQAPLYETDEKGAPVGDPEGGGDGEPDDGTDPEDDDAYHDNPGNETDNVARPNFSHQDDA